MIVVRSPLIIFQGLYIGFDFFRFVEDGQIAVYAGEGKDGEVLFVYNGKLHLSNLASKKYGTTYTERNSPQRSWSKEIFSEASVKNFVHSGGGGGGGGACVARGTCVARGGLHGRRVVWQEGMCGGRPCVAGGACIVGGGVCGRWHAW